MAGNLPKPTAERQRRNAPKSSARLPANPPRRRVPKLPARSAEQPWHELTVAMWRDLWRSPMATQFTKADLHTLYLLAEATDRFWQDRDLKWLPEIGRLRRDFGLTPYDRRRLEWTIEDDAPERSAPAPAEPMAPEADPRRLLAVV